jgi:hypothetical protein
MPKFWTAAGSEAPRRFRSRAVASKALSSLRSATALQMLVGSEDDSFVSIRVHSCFVLFVCTHDRVWTSTE